MRLRAPNINMGEAKRKNTRKAAFLKAHPYCCFCGGEEPATTVDHVPSKQMFRLKRRPAGLEFPACEQCNHSTGPHELVAALMSRLTENSTAKVGEKKEIKKLFTSVDKNRHGLLQEMIPSWQQQYDFYTLNHPEIPEGWGALNASSPMLNQSLQIFGAKLSKALHYEHTNKIVPKSGVIYVLWYSNYDRMTGNVPDTLINQLPEPKTLAQGKWNVSDQFEYSFIVSEDGKLGIYFATFQTSFAICGFVSFERDFLPDVEGMKAHIPGEPFCL